MSIFKRIFSSQKKSDNESIESSFIEVPIKIRTEKYNKEEFENVDYLKLLEDKLLTTGLDCSENSIYRTLKVFKLKQEGKLEEALELYLGNIDIYNADPDNESNETYLSDVLSIVDLYGRTNQKEKQIPYLENAIKQYPNSTEIDSWRLYFSKINKVNTKPNEILISPDIIKKQVKSNPSLGEKISLIKDELPEFNFYYDLSDESSETFYPIDIPREKIDKFFELKNEINKLIYLGKISENEGDFKTAIEVYRKIIIEEVEETFPYERLIIIYSKLKWLKEEIEIIEDAISFFRSLKNKQLKHVKSLAEKFNMTHKVEEYISQDKKIFYFKGKFELYTPHTSMFEKWEKRLCVKQKTFTNSK